MDRQIKNYISRTVLQETPHHIAGHKCINTFAGEFLEDAVEMGFGVYYSRDGKQLLEATTHLTSYQVEKGTEVICDGAFCETLATEILLPDTIQAIGFNAFGRTRLTSMVFPKNVCHIATVNPFASNYTLERLTIHSPHFIVEDGILYSSDHKVMYGAVTKDYPRELIIPDGVEVIANGAFIKRKLTSVYMPDSVRQIGVGAFCHTQVKEVRLSHSIRLIPTECFEDCQIETMDIPEGVETISDGALDSNTQLTTLILPSTLYTLGVGVLNNCPKLERITAPTSQRMLTLKTMKLAGLDDRGRLRSRRERCLIHGGTPAVTMVLTK